MKILIETGDAIEILAGSFVNGNWVEVGALGDMINFPFWLFFVSTAANLILFVKLIRDSELKHKPT